MKITQPGVSPHTNPTQNGTLDESPDNCLYSQANP